MLSSGQDDEESATGGRNDDNSTIAGIKPLFIFLIIIISLTGLKFAVSIYS